jgi:YesN/AraC family two-component response regulator
VVGGAPFSENVSTRLRVLIADDIQETRRNTRVMLAMNPEVEVVAIGTNGKHAVELAKKQNPDLAILDINMPDMDGLTAFEKMKEFNPDITCIIISAEKENQTLRRAMSVGAREYLIKPFTVDELNLAVHKVSQIIIQKRKSIVRNTRIREQREAYVRQLATEYAKTRRTDEKALQVFEHLANNPQCELRWLRILAMIYVIRQDWNKLKGLAARLEQQTDSE